MNFGDAKPVAAESTMTVKPEKENEMEIGLLAMARADSDTPCRDGMKAVLATMKVAPDLDVLLCGGHTLNNEAELEAVRLASTGQQTEIVLEVMEKPPGPRPLGYDVGDRSHRNVRICDGQILEMGFQTFGMSKEVVKPGGCARHTGWLADQLDQRTFEAAGRRCLLLTCGEIMTVVCRRRNNQLGPARFRIGVDARLIDAIKAADVILNPTHDIMSAQGGLHAKRRFLADRAGAYVSASNWNEAKGQKSSFRGVADIHCYDRSVVGSALYVEATNGLLTQASL